MKNSKLFVLAVFALLVAFLPLNTNAMTNIGKEEGRFNVVNERMYADFEDDGYLNLTNGHYYVKWLQNDEGTLPKIAYCLDINVGYTEGSTYTDQGATDIGIQYIIKNGFTGVDSSGQTYHYSTNDNCTADECQSLIDLKTNYPKNNTSWYDNYWLTQVAIWLYQGDSNESLEALRNVLNGTNLTENQQIVKNLVDGANAIKNSDDNFTVVNPKMTISNNELKLDNNYYYSELITPSDVGETFTISVNNSNYEVVDINKNVKTSFKKGDKFYIRVLNSKVTKSEEVTVTLSTSGSTYANQYVGDVATQRLGTYVVASLEAKTTSLKLNVNYACNLTVTVTNIETKEKICGGSFVIYDENGNIAKNSNGEEIGTIELSSDKCEVTVSLSDGKYKVVQQTAIDPYIKDSLEYEVNTETQCPLNVELKNEKLYQIKVLKINDREDNPIAGAKLRLEDSNGNIIKEFVSSTEAQIIDKLHKGTYYLSEIEAPSGYYLSEEKITIEVNEENNNKQFVFNNNEIIVPKTGVDSKIIVMGILLGIFGIFLIVYANKKRVYSK